MSFKESVGMWTVPTATEQGSRHVERLPCSQALAL
jgi:hypothetical protein